MSTATKKEKTAATPARKPASSSSSSSTTTTSTPSTPASNAASRSARTPRTASRPGAASATASPAAPAAPIKPNQHHLVSQLTELPPQLQNVVRPHLESFNFMLQKGGALDLAVMDIKAQTLEGDPLTQRPSFRFYIEDVQVGYPRKSDDDSADSRLWPHQCRELGRSYTAPMTATLSCQVADGPRMSLNVSLGDLPIMVKSSRCHLEHLSPPEMVKRKEEAAELGGYFICNGNERLIRLLIVPRRNHVFALQRSSFANRDVNYTDYATTIRCVRPDQSAQTITLHYLSDGTSRLRFTYRKQEFFIPAILMLKAFVDCTDREIFERITEGNAGNTFLSDRVELLIRDGKKYAGLRTRKQVLSFLGESFRVIMPTLESQSNEDVGKAMLQDMIFVHCNDSSSDATANRNKFNLLIFMIQKLYSMISGETKPDNPDALSAHEILLPGHLFAMVLKEKLQDWLIAIRAAIMKDIRSNPAKVSLTSEAYLKKVAQAGADVGKKLHYLLATGNLISNTGLDLQQVSGYTIVGEKLNWYRYLAHFRSVHRGQFFAETKTTAVRKLLPDSWGFMCPVHTPDGAPCGLLNHLANECVVLTHPTLVQRQSVLKVLVDLGMMPIQSAVVPPWQYLTVLLDGVVVGKIPPVIAPNFAAELRHMKVLNNKSIPRTLEITMVLDKLDGVYPGIYLATGPARMMRPVRFLGARPSRQDEINDSLAVLDATLAARRAAPAVNGPGFKVELKPFSAESSAAGAAEFADTSEFLDAHYSRARGDIDIEWIGSMEQVFMEIACTGEDFRQGETTHLEVRPTNMLSEIAAFTPFSDFNQSPRNMYQCQMGKQTMGTPYHSFPYRTDNKSYRIQTPQTPLVRNELYSKYLLDEYPLGTNAVVAVISYTGYDMEDAMILNKSSYERGFAHASVYKTKFIDLSDKRSKGEPIHMRFGNSVTHKDKTGKKVTTVAAPSLDKDGLPVIGTTLNPGDPLYCVVDSVTNKARITPHKDTESAVVEEIRALGPTNEPELQKIAIKMRYNRNPVIGDKFSSRHGQKGVLSRLWPQIDMPFSESGMTPDVIINPHAFPSRMTIGMLVESMAGKSGALHGIFQDGTPFRFSEQNRAVDYFGKQLVAAGYNYVGNERMYSGTTGVEFEMEIYLGVVYYQRLRHMVSDKEQVRATGPINALTRQPIKGRKVHGGIRFGEMERDSLIAHGAPYLLNDRLFLCSDYHTTTVCTKCGSLLSPMWAMKSSESLTKTARASCRNCASNKHCDTVAIPYVFCYLVNELAAMNIRLTLDVK